MCQGIRQKYFSGRVMVSPGGIWMCKLYAIASARLLFMNLVHANVIERSRIWLVYFESNACEDYQTVYSTKSLIDRDLPYIYVGNIDNYEYPKIERKSFSFAISRETYRTINSILHYSARMSGQYIGSNSNAIKSLSAAGVAFPLLLGGCVPDHISV